MTEFKHFVSLGHFCSVALDLEALGLRDASLPFDWNIDLDFSRVLDCIRDHFQGFLDYDRLSQSRADRAHYKNAYDVQFFHDFNRRDPLSEQLPAVQEKYARRIERFYREISEPTLFIRYIAHQLVDAEGNMLEPRYIAAHETEIRELLKSFNPDNEILYLGNDSIGPQPFSLYLMPADPGDEVARLPREACPEFGELLASFSIEGQEENRRRGALAAERRRAREAAARRERLLARLPGLQGYRHPAQY